MLINTPTQPLNLQGYLDDKRVKLDIFLDIICQRLQLDETRENKLNSAYKAITECIKNNDFFDTHEALMFAFGSRELNTVVKHYQNNEFDLDFAVQILLKNIDITPIELVEKLEDCLNANGNFKGKVKKIRYGVRVIYANQFHVDIMLGVKKTDDRLFVPDWKDDKWVNRNPKGYSKWFKNKYLADFKDIRLFSYYKEFYPEMLNERYIVESKAEVEDIEPAVIYPEIQPIQRITQLAKRHRDKFFGRNQKYKTSSIVLTTLVGDLYKNETSIYDGMNGFINGIFQLFRDDSPLFKIINPADRYLPEEQQENLTDKWEKDKEYYNSFRQYMNRLQRDWVELHTKETVRQQALFLQKIFGENIVNAAYAALNEEYKRKGFSYDNEPLPISNTMPYQSPQAALASVSKERKPYYGK